MAMSDLMFSVHSDMEIPDAVTRAKDLDEAVSLLMETDNGGIQITGTWRAGGKRGHLELVYVRLLSPTATHTFVLRFLKESIRLHIAKELMRLKHPDIESPDRR